MAPSSVGSNAPILEILCRDNYEDWRPRVKTYLVSEDLWEVVESNTEPAKLEDGEEQYKAWRKKNAKALYIIQNSCGREVFSFIREIETAKKAWEALEQVVEILQGIFDEENADHVKRFESFIHFVKLGDWDEAKKCLGKVDVHAVVARQVNDYHEGTALHVAAMAGHLHIVKELMALMTEEDLKTRIYGSGQTALHVAVLMGHLHIVEELPVLLIGELQDFSGWTALHSAVFENKIDIVKELVSLMRPEGLTIKDIFGRTALHLAAEYRCVHIVKALPVLYMGGLKDDAGNTALHIGVEKEDADIVKVLVPLMRPEDLAIKNDAGYTALQLAANTGNVLLVNAIMRKEKGNLIL